MAGIDGLLKYPAIEMEPGKLAIDEAFGAMSNRRSAVDLRLFLFYYSGLRGFLEVRSIPGRTPARFPAQAQRMYYRNDVSMTLTFPALAWSRCETAAAIRHRATIQPPAPGLRAAPDAKLLCPRV